MEHDCFGQRKSFHKLNALLQTNVGGSRISLEYSLSYCSESVWSDLITGISFLFITLFVRYHLLCMLLVYQGLISGSILMPFLVNDPV